MRTVTCLLVWFVAASTAAAQAPSTLSVQVSDPSGAAIPRADITAVGPGETIEVAGDAAGRATLSLPAGDWDVVVAADGFAARTERVRLAAGRSHSLAVELALSRVVETLTVTPESIAPAETRIGSDVLEFLADDAEALGEFISDIAGPDATVTVDGFEGGRMPSKDQIAEIVVINDPFSAQFHRVGSSRVNVVTRPGFGAWRGRAGLNLGSDALSARNPFAREKLPFRRYDGSVTASGPVPGLRTSFSADFDVRRRSETQPLLAITPQGLLRQEAEQRDERHAIDIRTTHALGRGGLLRNRIEWEAAERTGAGLGDIDLPERAYADSSRELLFRSSLTSQLPRGIRQELRLSNQWQTDRQVPVTDAVAIDVLGAFRAGGAQVRGTRRLHDLEVAGDWLFPSRGRHTLRTGVQVERTHYASSNVRDYLGTFVFAGLDAYLADAPLTFTRRLGSTEVDFTDTRTGIYLHDDVRLTRALSLGLGLRHELQSAIDDRNNLAPRVSLNWTTQNDTTVQVAVGAFYEWHDSNLVEEAQRLEGSDSYEEVVREPGYPDPLDGGTAVAPLPPTRLIASDDLRVARQWRTSLSVEKRFGPLRVRSTVYRQIGNAESRSRNVNAPIDGVRPDPASGNVLLLSSTGRSRRLAADINVSASSLWKRRLSVRLRSSIGEFLNDGDGGLRLPADSRYPEREWGPSSNDVRHRGYASVNLRLPQALNLGVSARWRSAPPFTITTGTDSNGDTITNDRPEGIGRNSERGRGYWYTDLHIGWTRPLVRGGAPRPGQRGEGGRGGPEAGVTLTARNVFNQPQYGSFNGVVTSALFGRPVSARNPRRIELGMRVSF